MARDFVGLFALRKMAALGHQFTLVLHGADDPVNSPAMSAGKERFFTGRYQRELIARCGHFPQREQADEVARQTIAWLRS